jgi:hypothetical protein
MRRKEIKRNAVKGRAVLFGGLMLGTLAFSAGVVGARSHKPVELRPGAAVVQTETRSASAGAEAIEPRWINPSDQRKAERRLPGHPELDLQLD